MPAQVSKSAQSGEFVPKGAFIIRGKRNLMRCILETAIGEIIIDDVKKIMGGPVEAVKGKAERYAILRPGSVKKNEVSSILSKIFDVSTEAIQKALPPGDVEIIETVGFVLK